MSDESARAALSALRWEVVQQLHTGTASRVYQVKQGSTVCAAKAGPVGMITVEYKGQSHLSHPGLLCASQFLVHGGVGVLLMPLAQPLRITDEELAASWLAELRSALTYMHSQGLVHGNVTAANLLILGEHLVVIDFGSVAPATEALRQEDLRAADRALTPHRPTAVAVIATEAPLAVIAMEDPSAVIATEDPSAVIATEAVGDGLESPGGDTAPTLATVLLAPMPVAADNYRLRDKVQLALNQVFGRHVVTLQSVANDRYVVWHDSYPLIAWCPLRRAVVCEWDDNNRQVFHHPVSLRDVHHHLKTARTSIFHEIKRWVHAHRTSSLTTLEAVDQWVNEAVSMTGLVLRYQVDPESWAVTVNGRKWTLQNLSQLPGTLKKWTRTWLTAECLHLLPAHLIDQLLQLAIANYDSLADIKDDVRVERLYNARTDRVTQLHLESTQQIRTTIDVALPILRPLAYLKHVDDLRGCVDKLRRATEADIQEWMEKCLPRLAEQIGKWTNQPQYTLQQCGSDGLLSHPQAYPKVWLLGSIRLVFQFKTTMTSFDLTLAQVMLPGKPITKTLEEKFFEALGQDQELSESSDRDATTPTESMASLEAMVDQFISDY